MNHFHKIMSTPIGALTLIADQKNLLAVLWGNKYQNKKMFPLGKESLDNPILQETEKQLNEYFAGQRKKFTLPTRFIYGTDFQKKVWRALITIPYGQTISYSKIANKIGSPKANRAVGGASSKNFISIIIPCHRVIGKDGSLTGFTGGLKKKDFLLRLEHNNEDSSI